MSQSQVFTNTFSGGMSADVDSHLQRNNTYRFAIGARLAWNTVDDPAKTLEENVKNGVTLAICNARGNRFEIALCLGYKMVGSVNTSKGTCLFITNGTYSEIGLFELNDNIFAPNAVKYTTLFNDKHDPNADRLHFDQNFYIHGFYVDENEFSKRVYFVDSVNQKRVINIPLFYNAVGETYHNQGLECGAEQTYPKHMSVHAFDERMDLVFPRIKFQRRIAGKVKSGTYQIVVQYRSKTGHSSVWSPLDRYTYVTDQKMDGELGGVANAYQTNHHNRTMGASNIVTQEGLRYSLEGIDRRWDQIAVAYVYHTTSVSFQEANLYKVYDIVNSNLTVDITGHTGISITRAEINQRFETVLSVGTTAQQENRTWDGNLELLPDLTLDLSTVTIQPAVSYYRADSTIEPAFTPVSNPVSGKNDNDPITNTFPTTGTFTINNFAGDVESYENFNDYANYKGQQFNHLYKGYFRGETYGWAIVILDRKGNPLFAQHISDYTFPQQFDAQDAAGNPTDWTLTRKNADNKYDLRIMGAKISNFKIPENVLRDKFGKLNISGFMIVRTERIARIACQGLMFNCNISVNASSKTNVDAFIHAPMFYDNRYILKPVNGTLPNAHIYYSIVQGSSYLESDKHEFPGPEFSSGLYFNFHSPDILIEQKLSEQLLAGQMEKVGFVHKGYSESVDVFSAHFYTKLYKTLPLTFLDETEKVANARAKMGTKSRIKFAFLHDQGPRHVYVKFDPDNADKYDYRSNVQAFFAGQKYQWKSTQQPYSVIMRLLDWKLVDSIESNTSRETTPLVNWKVTPDSYYTDQDEGALQNRRYIPTGHFQPITESILAKSKKNYKSNGDVESYQFDEMEVWGGDCYNSLFDFTRMYPEYDNCVKYDGHYPDYSVSLISPIESKYNLSLLFGRRYAANCVMPMRTSCIGENEQLSNGIQPLQPEDWTYNEVLLLEETTKLYLPKPADTKIITHRESGIWWSPKKTYGELEDSYRQRLVGDYGDVIGEYGKIQRFVPAFNSLYCVQDSAFGQLQTSLKSFIPSDTGDIVVKSGDVFGGIQYYSKKYGTQHPNSVWGDDNQIGFVDARKGKIMVFSQAGLNTASEEDGENDAITQKSIYFDRNIEHSPASGRFVDIVSGIDEENGEVVTSFHHTLGTQPASTPKDRVNEMKSFTIQYNKKAGVFHSYQHFCPYIYFSSGRYLLSPNQGSSKQNEIYLYNHGKYGEWFGSYYDTIVEFEVNPQVNVAKSYDNQLINVNFDGFQRIKSIVGTVNNNVHQIIAAQNTGSAIIFPDDRVRFIEDSLRFPLHQLDPTGVKERLRGHVLRVKITIDNSQQLVDGKDQIVAITSVDNKYRISHRIQY